MARQFDRTITQGQPNIHILPSILELLTAVKNIKIQEHERSTLMIVNIRTRLVALGVALSVIVGTSLTLASTTARNGVINRGVQNRMAAMNSAKSAVEILSNMMAGRIRFDRKAARAARKTLIKTTKTIPSAFEKPHTDPLSQAKPEIWIRWNDFKARSLMAKQAARALNPSRLETLRSTLPRLIRTCLNCHQTFRSSP
jgi:cytochrome c556